MMIIAPKRRAADGHQFGRVDQCHEVPPAMMKPASTAPKTTETADENNHEGFPDQVGRFEDAVGRRLSRGLKNFSIAGKSLC